MFLRATNIVDARFGDLSTYTVEIAWLARIGGLTRSVDDLLRFFRLFECRLGYVPNEMLLKVLSLPAAYAMKFRLDSIALGTSPRDGLDPLFSVYPIGL